MAYIVQSTPDVHVSVATPASDQVDISQNEFDTCIENDDRLFQASNDSDDVPATRLHRDAGTPPLSRADTRVAISALWSVYQNCRTTLGLPDKGRGHDRLKGQVRDFLRGSSGAQMSAQEMQTCSELFRSMQSALERHINKKTWGQKLVPAALRASRSLKWHFEVSVHECVKRRLDDGLKERLGTMKPGASQSFRMRGGVGANVVPGVGAGITYASDSTLSVTPTEWVVDSRTDRVTLSADADVLSFVEAELGLSVAASRSEIYGSLVDYVTNASHKFTTWIKHSPIALIAKIRDLFTISSSYEHDRARADFSSDCLEDDLIALCGKSLDIARYGLTTQPVERQDTYMGEVHAGVSANIGVSANLSVAGRKFVTIKQARQDILSLADSKPEVARRLLSGSPLVCTPEKLLEVMRGHLKQSSREITSELMTGRQGRGIEDMKARAQYLLEQFALLKLSGELDPEVEAIFMELFKERERILRPHSLAVYELSSRQSKWQAELNAGVGLGTLLPDGVHGNVTYEKVTEDEDPYYCGSFLMIDLAGTVDVANSVAQALDAVGVRAGSVWGVGEIRNALSNVGIDADAGVTTTMRFKLKEDGVALMYSIRGVRSTCGAGGKTPTPVSVTAGVSWADHSADVLTIGSHCLDMLAPMMRQRLTNASDGGGAWWQDFSTRHKDELDEMYFQMATPVRGTTLEADLQRIVQEVPATQHLLDALREAAADLAQAPTPNHREKTNAAMAAFMLAYVEGGYGQNVSRKWHLSVDGKRLPDLEGEANRAMSGNRGTGSNGSNSGTSVLAA
ncbi:hypothetical protein [Pandoraea oxalativorans]|uniref:Uncharacterized protein n=1 Tax=Pandoraea oxalativorans TaxID=573737 RepID=A0A0E3Y9F2_9BURK|nr:hypothetical protein [Pandoraea oxalativorans]AKC69026.1 hypothetical protein MB84_05425 [Pandoraea oxalativorans]